ncbi:MAG: calcium-binding protein [Desulfobacula sp.]
MPWGGDGNGLLIGFAGINEAKQTINPNESDNDWLYGGAGTDTLLSGLGSDYLDGVTGMDIMTGQGGDDTYYVDNAGDQVIENADEGQDTVQTSVGYTLGDNVENLILLDFSMPEKGLVDGLPSLVYGYPKRNEQDYMQGDANPDYQGTCALTAIANKLIEAYNEAGIARALGKGPCFWPEIKCRFPEKKPESIFFRAKVQTCLCSSVNLTLQSNQMFLFFRRCA